MAGPAPNAPRTDRARTSPGGGGPRPTRGVLSPEELARLRRRWWIPVVVTVLVAGVVYAVLMLGGHQYSAQATLELFSQEKTPAEDTVLAAGYVDFFNEPASQASVRQRAGVDPSAVLAARLAASGPIVYVTATASDPQVAQNAANAASTAFRIQMDRSLTAAETGSPVARSKKSPTTLDVLQFAQGASTVTQSKTRTALPWVAGAFLLSLVAVVLVPGRRRNQGDGPGTTGQDVAIT